MSNRSVIITGITGQTGSYLTEHLLNDDYEVYGIIRRSSSFSTERLNNVLTNPKLHLIYGDMADINSLTKIVSDIKPDMFFNMAAMSHVKVSFEIPEYTLDITGTGVIRCLETIRQHSPLTRFYQASSSELFGSSPPPQNEDTTFHPRSPYAVAKLAGYWATVNYREAYGIHGSNGVLYNHESMAEFEPVIFKEGKNGHIQIKPIGEVVRLHLSSTRTIDTTKLEYQEFEPDRDVYVWDDKGWTKIKFASAYPHSDEENKKPRFLVSKNACYMSTKEHHIIMADKTEKEQQDIKIGDKVNLVEYPSVEQLTNDVFIDEAELLGFIAGDGFVSKDFRIRITGKNKEELEYFEKIWNKMGGFCRFTQFATELSCDLIWHCDFSGNTNWIKKFKLYDCYHKKCVPWQILNADKNIKEAFLRGYMKADGLNAVPLAYEYKGFASNSATLVAGILFLINEITGQNYNINIECSNKWSNKTSIYYKVNILSNSRFSDSLKKYNIVKEMLKKKMPQRQICRDTKISRTFIREVSRGYIPPKEHHLEKDNDEIKKIVEWFNYDGWFYDIETESGTFQCGVGKGHVHNSPRRLETFVTRKITRAVGRIKHGLQNELVLGNLEAKRDWGHARDYAAGIKMILEYEHPDDFVLATGEAHTVREFVEEAFQLVGLDPYKYVKQDEKYFRPAEVDYLLGDAEKAYSLLGWTPTIKFKELVKEMVDYDCKLAHLELLRDRKAIQISSSKHTSGISSTFSLCIP